MTNLNSYLRLALEGGTDLKPQDLSPGDLGQVMQLARANKLALFLGKYLKNNSLSSDIRQRLNDEQQMVAQLNGHVLHLAGKVSHLFDDARIPHFFFKGPLQQKLLYGDFFLKPSLDLDVLVPRNMFAHARTTLLSSGFAVPSGHDSLWWTYFLGEQPFKLYGEKSLSVDLHHRLQQPGCPTPRHLSYFFENTQTVQVGSKKLRTPNLSAIVVIAAMNLLKAIYHREPGGSYAFDLLAALKRLDGPARARMVRDIAAIGLKGTVLGAAKLSAEAFGVENPLELESNDGWPQISSLNNGLFDPAGHTGQFPRRRSLLVNLVDQPVPYTLTNLARWGLSEGARLLFEH